MLKEVKSSTLYLEVLNKAQQAGYSLNLSVFDDHSEFAKYNAAGIHRVNSEEKTITIGIKEEDEDLGVYVHELLHADLFLSGYPKCYSYPFHTFGEGVNGALLEIENIAHHTLIYKE